MRKKLVCGNWKLNGTMGETRKLIFQLTSIWKDEFAAVDVAVCPPFTSLHIALEATQDTVIRIGAQNCFHEEHGAFTGEIAPSMLVELGCSYVILGHSERRTIFRETSAEVSKKMNAALTAGLTPIICIGETEQQRDQDKMEDVLRQQVAESLANCLKPSDIIIAYEPVWAIGTGKTATPEQAQEAHAFIRSELGNHVGDELAQTTRILYGGSVKGDNAKQLFAQQDIDGGLIGGASLKAESFAAIIHGAAEVQMKLA